MVNTLFFSFVLFQIIIIYIINIIKDVDMIRFVFESLGKNQRAVIQVLLQHRKGLFGSQIRRLTKLQPSILTKVYDALESRGVIIREYPSEMPPYSVHVRLSPLALSYFDGM